MGTRPLVSIIMPVYNAGKFLAEAIASVKAQTYTHWELLLVDDASTDGSRAIAERLSKEDTRIRFFQLKTNQGTGAARNKTVGEAQGEYIAFLDADDRWRPEKLNRQLEFMQREQALICYSSYALMDEAGKPLRKKVTALPFLDFKKLCKSNYVGNLTAIYNAKVLGKMPIPILRKRQDWAMWLNLVKKAGIAHGMPEVLADYRVRSGSISSNKWEMLKYNHAVYRKHLKSPALKSMLLMVCFLWEYFFVKPKRIRPL